MKLGSLTLMTFPLYLRIVYLKKASYLVVSEIYQCHIMLTFLCICTCANVFFSVYTKATLFVQFQARILLPLQQQQN